MIAGFVKTVALRTKLFLLVRQLNSTVESEAKHAASLLDRVLYPRHGPGPRVISASESQRIDEQHYGTLRGSSIIKPLVQIAGRGTPFARAYALMALGAIKDARGVALGRQALGNDSPSVRTAAIKCLWFLRDAPATPMLIPVLRDPEPLVRASAASALGSFGSPGVVPELIALFQRGDSGDKVAAVHALGDIRDPQSLPLIREALVAKDSKLRKAAKAALAGYDLARRRHR
ncbi:MAG TPA: HEAT repeat domain-containing protein [Candidatus Dormibacteraeota bacterium]|nr:HEAT repeat domain-containing protein [Candidatus Dormibacteraeota bacterium]